MRWFVCFWVIRNNVFLLKETFFCFQKVDALWTRVVQNTGRIWGRTHARWALEMPETSQHHEQRHSTQKSFQKQVDSLRDTITSMGNPFLDDFPELVTLYSRECASESAVNTVQSLETIGKERFDDYVSNVIEKGTRSVHSTIKKNNLALFWNPKPKKQSKQGKKIKVLQNNVSLFGQLHVSLHNRENDLEEFFGHEIQSYPPSFQTLERFICQPQRVTSWNVWSNLTCQIHHRTMTAKCWMVL